MTAGAFSKTPKKLKHTAFIELNKRLVDIYHKNDDIKRLNGFRLVAFDGSDIILPNNDEIKYEFGSIKVSNGSHKELDNRVGGASRFPSSHTTVQALSHTAVSIKCLTT